MAIEYRIRLKYADNPGKYPVLLRTMPDGTVLNLLGNTVERDVAASKTRPAHKRTYKGATQADLKFLYDYDKKHSSKPNLFIEEVEVPDKPAEEAKPLKLTDPKPDGK